MKRIRVICFEMEDNYASLMVMVNAENEHRLYAALPQQQIDGGGIVRRSRDGTTLDRGRHGNVG